jgi:hypothetical protein
MKKVMLVSFVLAFALVAMVACKSGMMGGPEGQKIHGKVKVYEPGKSIQLFGGYQESSKFDSVETGADEENPEPAKQWIFQITPATKVTGDIKVGSRVTIRYTQGATMEAISIERFGK